MVAEAFAQYELEQKKLKQRKGYVQVPFDDSKILPRIPEDLVCKLYTQRLQLNDWRFKGGIIDGYPRTLDCAKAIFEIPATEIPTDQNEIFYPQKIIYIDAPDDWIRERLKKIGGHEGTHFSDEGVCRRMPVYRKLVGSSNNQELIEYFEEKGAKVISIQLNEEWEQVCEKGLEFNSEILAKIKDFIESEGKFKVYEKWVDEREPLKEQQQEQKEEIKEKSLGNLTEINVKQLKSQQEMLDHNMRFLQIQQKEIDILDSRSKPIRQYLSDLVLPSVIEGLIQVTKFMPQDPIDFLVFLLVFFVILVMNLVELFNGEMREY